MNSGPDRAPRQARVARRAAQRRAPRSPPAERMAAAEAVAAAHARRIPLLAHPGYVAGYWATGGEVPLHVLQMRLPPARSGACPASSPTASSRSRPGAPATRWSPTASASPSPTSAPASLLAAAEMALVAAAAARLHRRRPPARHGRRLSTTAASPSARRAGAAPAGRRGLRLPATAVAAGRSPGTCALDAVADRSRASPLPRRRVTMTP